MWCKRTHAHSLPVVVDLMMGRVELLIVLVVVVFVVGDGDDGVIVARLVGERR